MTVHVMDPPDHLLGPDESLCTDHCGTEVVFHPACTPFADGWICLMCGETSTSQREAFQ
jgi:hypothetical protein